MPSRRSSAPAAVGARSLADDIRGRNDEELARLLLGRPDLARPAPADLTSLAARASTRASVQRCLETLDQGHLQVLEAVLVAEGSIEPSAVASLLATRSDVTAFVDRLWDLALVWRGGRSLHVVRTVAEVLGPHPGGLGPSVLELTGRPAPDDLRSRIDAAPEEARAILDRLAWGPPVGVLGSAGAEPEVAGPAGAGPAGAGPAGAGPAGAGPAGAGPAGAGPAGAGPAAARWLLAHGLLHPYTPKNHPFSLDKGESLTRGSSQIPGERVVLPREVGLLLRNGRIHDTSRLFPPDVIRTDVGAATADAVAGGQVSDLLALVEEVAERWGPDPPRVLRTGGLAVRDLRRLGDALDLEPERAAWLLEMVLSAGLIADDGGIVPVWAPTAAFDEWLALGAGTRWARLATAWLASTRAAHLVGTRTVAATSRAVPPANALGPDVHWPPVRAVRADVLAELARLAPGEAASPESVLERLRWRRPLRNAALLDEAAGAVLREAEWLGVTGRGALSGAGRALVTGADVAILSRQVSDQLPLPVDHVLIQADLTAIAPGPLEGSLAQLLRLTADVESRGGATVHRFTPGSVRRALDVGWTADELADALRRASRTGLPQPVEYLVRDVARRHGQTRVGGATAYLRSDDPSVLESMLADRALAAIQLRRIAPTVLVSSAVPRVLLELLRENGYAPVQERPDGSVVVADVVPRRAAGGRPVAPPTRHPVDATATASLVQQLRVGEAATRFRRRHDESGLPRLEPTDPTVTLAALRDAAADRHGVWIGYADRAGGTERILFYPTRVEGGRAYGRVADGAEERSFSIHRITGVATS